VIHDDISDVTTVVLTAVFAYVWLVLLLRVSGKRTLSQLNAFDFIVTVALGSIMASTILSASVAWTEGAAALAALAALQFVAAWGSTRFDWVRTAITSQPTVLLRDGQMDTAAMLRGRIDEDSLCAAVRSNGIGDLSSVASVVLETDGTLSVISRTGLGCGSAMPRSHRTRD